MFKQDEDGEWEIIGIHVGFFKKKKANLATLITHKLKNWIIGCIEGQIPIDIDFEPKAKRTKEPVMYKQDSNNGLEILLKEAGKEPTITSSYVLKLDGKSDKDKEFIFQAQNIKFPPYTKLEIVNLEGFNTKESIDTFVEFL